MEKEPSPMKMILQEIERALEARLYYLAVVMALTLPDICAALESADGRTTKQKYKEWYRSNLAATFSFLTDDDIYSLRCGVVHQGQFGQGTTQYDRPLFVLPHSNVTFMNCTVGAVGNTAYLCSVEEFCRGITSGVRAWYLAKSADANVQANLSKLVQYRPNGYGPLQGAAVIA